MAYMLLSKKGYEILYRHMPGSACYWLRRAGWTWGEIGRFWMAGPPMTGKAAHERARRMAEIYDLEWPASANPKVEKWLAGVRAL